jgi:hypothetical protein
MKHVLLQALAASIVAAAGLQPLAKLHLLDVGFGPTTRLLTSSTPPAVVPFAVGDVALGTQFAERVGVGIGTSVVEGNLLTDISLLPARGFLFCDFSPGRRWRKGVGFLSFTYVHSGQDGWSGARLNPYWKLMCGASYTWYVVTPHAELGYDWHNRFATLAAGVAIGGTYTFR